MPQGAGFRREGALLARSHFDPRTPRRLDCADSRSDSSGGRGKKKGVRSEHASGLDHALIKA
jgi:hypothetical protein